MDLETENGIVVLKRVKSEEPEKIQNNFKSLHERQKEYDEARERIYGDWLPNKVSETKKYIKECRIRYKNRKRCKNAIESTILKEEEDQRPFARVSIGKEKVFGLLDSGASISALGQGAEDLLERNQIKWNRINSNVKTADGSSQSIVGKATIPVEYNGLSEKITFYIVPTLKQTLPRHRLLEEI